MPLVSLFTAAVSRYLKGDRKVPEELVMSAFQGVLTLKQRYKKGENSQKAQEIIRRVRACLPLSIMKKGIYLEPSQKGILNRTITAAPKVP